MADFSIRNLNDLRENATKELGDDQLPLKVLDAHPDYEIPFEVNGVAFTMTPHGGARVYVFNSPSKDEDSLGVLGDRDGDAKDDDLPPQIDFRDEGAWMKYEIGAGVKAAAGDDVSELKLKVEGEKKLGLYDYRYHSDRSKTVKDAIVEDVPKLRWAVRPECLDQLTEKEAVVYRVSGSLSTAVEISWSDVFTANLNAFGRLLGTGSLLAIRASTLATLKFDVGVSDDFLLVLSYHDANRVRLAVKKSKISRLGAAATLGVTAQFVPSEESLKALAQLVDDLVAKATERIEKLIEDEELDELLENESNLLGRLAKQLGVAEESGRAERMKQLSERLGEELNKRIRELAENKVELAFEYEYLRIKAESTLLDAVLPKTVLKENHPDLIRRDLGNILGWMRNPRNGYDLRQLNRYLHQTEFTTESAWGLMASVGKWKYGGRDSKRFEVVEQRNIHDQKRLAFLRKRGYDAEEFGDKFGYVVEVIGQMKKFSREEIPTADEFELGLRLKWSWQEKELDEDELMSYFDHAAIWRIIGIDDHEEILSDVGGKFGRRATVTLDVVVEALQAPAIFEGIAQSDGDRLARALAKATPRWKDYAARNVVERRTNLYAPLWKYYLEHSGLRPATYARVAADHLAKQGVKIANLEKHWTSYVGTFGSLIQKNASRVGSDYSGTLVRWGRLSTAMKDLIQARKEERAYTEVAGRYPAHVSVLGSSFARACVWSLCVRHRSGPGATSEGRENILNPVPWRG